MEKKAKSSPAEQPPETVSEIFDFVSGVASRFEKKMLAENGFQLLIDTDALNNACQSYIDDVVRYKDYHKTKLPDTARRSAYLCKWLMKFRPIVALNPEAPLSKQAQTFALMTNELFVMLCVGAILEFEWTQLGNKMTLLLLYTLRHRYNSEDTYILFFAQLCNL